MKQATAIFALLAFSAPAFAETQAERARQLGENLADLMVMTYVCQDFIGGTGQYRLVKQDAISTIGRLTGDRNAAVLMIDDKHQELVAAAGHEQLRARSAAEGAALDFTQSCLEEIADLQDQVSVSKAHLNLH